MTIEQVARLRSFNRTVTERVGALELEYLGQGRPLGESRLLWEIGIKTCDVRDLRRRLGLDSGYVSRLLRSLEAQGLVRVDESASDARMRTARLTPHGRAERAKLDRLSDDLAVSILEPLEDGQRAKLVEAAETVERLLYASTITISIEDPASADARWCAEQYFAELRVRFEGGYDPALAIPLDADDLRPPQGLLLVARLRGQAVGCGALRELDGPAVHLKRMWVDQSVRGLGLGRRLLRELEAQAAAAGATTLRLETNKALSEAILLYRSSGYDEVPPFNDERYGDHWFEKHL